jgi:transcriptional regulator with XRE-family HTH domain
MLELLVRTRKAAGLTQQDLAGRLGRPQSFVSKVELGERRLDVIEFLELCRAIGVDPHQLLDDIAKTTYRRDQEGRPQPG